MPDACVLAGSLHSLARTSRPHCELPAVAD